MSNDGTSGETSKRKDSVKLWGREFSVVKNGLSETEVETFVNQLVKEQDALIQNQAHLSALTKLAERTVTEAEKLAEEIKREASNKAEAEASKTIEAARARAEQVFEERRTEIMAEATKQAEVIRAVAEREGEMLLERYRRRAQPELRTMVEKTYVRLVSELEKLKEGLQESRAGIEQRLSEIVEQASVENEKSDDLPQQLMDMIDSGGQSNGDLEKPEWQLEFLPPVDIMKIMQVVTYVDELPEVAKTEIIPADDGTSILVFLRRPLDLIEVLKAWPEVAEAEEDTRVPHTDEGPRKVLVTLPVKNHSRGERG